MSFRYENDMLSNLFVFSWKGKKDSKKSKDRSFKSIRVLSHITNFYLDNADSTLQASFFFIWVGIQYQQAVLFVSVIGYSNIVDYFSHRIFTN